MKRFYAHPNEVNVFENDVNYIYAGTNDNNVKVYFSNEIKNILSPREFQVFNLNQYSKEEISIKLNISEKTVEKYLQKLKNKKLL